MNPYGGIELGIAILAEVFFGLWIGYKLGERDATKTAHKRLLGILRVLQGERE